MNEVIGETYVTRADTRMTVYSGRAYKLEPVDGITVKICTKDYARCTGIIRVALSTRDLQPGKRMKQVVNWAVGGPAKMTTEPGGYRPEFMGPVYLTPNETTHAWEFSQSTANAVLVGRNTGSGGLGVVNILVDPSPVISAASVVPTPPPAVVTRGSLLGANPQTARRKKSPPPVPPKKPDGSGSAPSNPNPQAGGPSQALVQAIARFKALKRLSIRPKFAGDLPRKKKGTANVKYAHMTSKTSLRDYVIDMRVIQGKDPDIDNLIATARTEADNPANMHSILCSLLTYRGKTDGTDPKLTFGAKVALIEMWTTKKVLPITNSGPREVENIARDYNCVDEMVALLLGIWVNRTDVRKRFMEVITENFVSSDALNVFSIRLASPESPNLRYLVEIFLEIMGRTTQNAREVAERDSDFVADIAYIYQKPIWGLTLLVGPYTRIAEFAKTLPAPEIEMGDINQQSTVDLYATFRVVLDQNETTRVNNSTKLLLKCCFENLSAESDDVNTVAREDFKCTDYHTRIVLAILKEASKYGNFSLSYIYTQEPPGSQKTALQTKVIEVADAELQRIELDISSSVKDRLKSLAGVVGLPLLRIIESATTILGGNPSDVPGNIKNASTRTDLYIALRDYESGGSASTVPSSSSSDSDSDSESFSSLPPGPQDSTDLTSSPLESPDLSTTAVSPSTIESITKGTVGAMINDVKDPAKEPAIVESIRKYSDQNRLQFNDVPIAPIMQLELISRSEGNTKHTGLNKAVLTSLFGSPAGKKILGTLHSDRLILGLERAIAFEIMEEDLIAKGEDTTAFTSEADFEEKVEAWLAATNSTGQTQ